MAYTFLRLFCVQCIPVGDNDAPDAVTVNAADVVSYGLNIVVPLMTTELLKVRAIFFLFALLYLLKLVARIVHLHSLNMAV